MGSESKQCPNCGAALFWAEDVGDYCTSCGWKEGPTPERERRPAQGAGYIPGLFSRHEDAHLYTNVETVPRFFNLGAFFAPFLWCAAMRLWGWAVTLVLIPAIVMIVSTLFVMAAIWGVLTSETRTLMAFESLMSLYLVPFAIAAGFELCMAVYLAFFGSSMAWESRPFESVQEFVKVQRTWAVAGFIIFILWAGLTFGSLRAGGVWPGTGTEESVPGTFQP